MKINSLKKSFLNSSFYKVIHIIKKDPLNYLYTIILDFLFLALILFIGRYTGSLIPQNPEQLMALFKTQSALLLFAIVYPLVYYLVIILIYSSVKMTILNLVRSLHEKINFSFKGFWKFYWMNVLVFLIFVLAGLVLLGISALILTQSFLKYFILILAIPFFFFLYSIINISGTIFIKSPGKGMIKKSFSISFNKIKEYGMFIVWDILFILIYLIIYNLIHLFFRTVVFSNDALLSSYGGVYLTAFNIISLVFFYIIISFNRVYFYKRIDKNVL
ncbi:MAG: hypothetical protein KKC54_03230 [Nanoarchaeota archaeon]|nr:hypothetical protein [Nanoarchaeota archaeon]